METRLLTSKGTDLIARDSILFVSPRGVILYTFLQVAVSSSCTNCISEKTDISDRPWMAEYVTEKSAELIRVLDGVFGVL